MYGDLAWLYDAAFSWDIADEAAWDGDRRERPALPLGPGLEGKPLVWHELVRA